MPAPISQTVSYSKKRQVKQYEPEEIFLSETFVLLPGEDPTAVRRDIYLSLKAQALELIRIDPEQRGFTSGAKAMAAAGTESGLPAAPTGKEAPPSASSGAGDTYTSPKGQVYHYIEAHPADCPVCGKEVKETPEQYITRELRDSYQVWQCKDKNCGWRGALKKGGS